MSIEQVRMELTQRISALDTKADRLATRELASEVDAVRRIAQSHGLFPAATVAHVLDTALSRGERGALVHGWLGILRDAVGSERQDRPACDAYAAACSVRLAG